MSLELKKCVDELETTIDMYAQLSWELSDACAQYDFD